MKTLLLLFLASLLSFGAKAQDFYLMQLFDGDDTIVGQSAFFEFDTSAANIWQVGPPQKTIFNSAYSAPNLLITDTLLPYPPNTTSSFIFSFDVLPWDWYGILAIEWMQKLDMEYLHDGGIIEYSIDTGATWTNVVDDPYVYNFYGFEWGNLDTISNGEMAFTGIDTSWDAIWLCFDLSWLYDAVGDDTTNMQIRYTFVSDSSENTHDGWELDNFYISKTYVHTVAQLESGDYLTAYPNPTNDRLYIALSKVQEYHIIEHMELITLDGKVVGRWEHIPTKFFIDTSIYPNGMYLLNVTSNLQQASMSIVIQH